MTVAPVQAPVQSQCCCGPAGGSQAPPAQGPANPLAPAGGPLADARTGTSQQASLFHHRNSQWMQIPGRASDSPSARSAYAAVQELVRQYPTEAALKAAGFTTDKPGGNHYKVGHRRFWSDGQTSLSHLVVKNGVVVQAQFDSKSRRATDPPPQWSGVQWHYHDHGKSSWMFHVSVGKPIDEAFIEHPGH